MTTTVCDQHGSEWTWSVRVDVSHDHLTWLCVMCEKDNPTQLTQERADEVFLKVADLWD
ncbi:hypothetical protein ACIBSW_34485 [Actinoplanes sp. NPDC049668]|uniref:hypothetical protein n=1 Tax=unclassified Actinoplanes TaxID=2626549 RepID=UPI0033AAE976